MKGQTFGKRDHDQCSVNKHGVSQMLRHSNRLWLLELHKAHPRRHRHRRVTIEEAKKMLHQIAQNCKQSSKQCTFFVLSFHNATWSNHTQLLAHSQFNVKMHSVHPSNHNIHTQYCHNDNKHIPQILGRGWPTQNIKRPITTTSLHPIVPIKSRPGSLLLAGLSFLDFISCITVFICKLK